MPLPRTTRHPRRRRGQAVTLAAVTVTALLATACSGEDAADGEDGPAGSASAEDRPDLDAPPLEPLPAELPDELLPYYEQELNWRGCGSSGFQCATLTVPLDYENPDPAEDLQLAVSRVQATGSGEPLGSLLVNPGGPGASAVEFLQAYAGLAFPQPVREQYDMVGLDPRGTGDSEPVECLADAEMDEHTMVDRTPDTEAEVRELVASFEAFGAACQERSGRLLEHISTVESARDHDVLRAVLGDEQLHYYGASYGTKLGATYAGLFPERAGRLVLDAAMDPRLSTRDTDREQAGGFETAFRAFAEDCGRHDDCPLGTDGGDAASERLTEFFTEVDAEPLPTDDGRPLTESLATTGVFSALYAEWIWPELREALTAAFDEGDGTGLLQLADDYHERGPDGSYGTTMFAFPAISCLDSPAAFPDAEAAEAAVAEFEEDSPTFGREFAWATLACAAWPVEPSGTPVTIEAAGAEDILVIGTTRDPATPYAWAEGLADQLDSGVLLTFDGDGHSAYGADACIDSAVNDYLLENTSPEDGTTCP